jgi:hypothetical protein
MEDNNKFSKISFVYDNDNVINCTEKVDRMLTNLHKLNKGVLCEQDTMM